MKPESQMLSCAGGSAAYMEPEDGWELMDTSELLTECI